MCSDTFDAAFFSDWQRTKRRKKRKTRKTSLVPTYSIEKKFSWESCQQLSGDTRHEIRPFVDAVESIPRRGISDWTNKPWTRANKYAQRDKKKQKVVETFTLYAGVYRGVYLCAQGFSSVL